MMRGLEVTKLGGLNHLRVATMPKPEPGPNEVLVRIAAASLNYRDYALMIGKSSGKAQPPYIPLSDACGYVEAVGEGVSRVRVGDRVCPTFYQSWIDGSLTPEQMARMLGSPLAGVAREYAVFDERFLVVPPSHLTDAEASTLPCAALTAWRALTDGVKLWSGNSVLVQGTGGVSSFALQFAVAAGLEVIVTSSSDSKLEQARALGARHCINYRNLPNWAEEVRTLTGGRGVDAVVEVGGAGTLQQSLRAARFDGHIAIVGMLTSAVQELSVQAIYASNMTLRGVTVGSRAMFEQMNAAISLHHIKPLVGEIHPWEAAREAFQSIEAGRHTGKIVLTFAS